MNIDSISNAVKSTDFSSFRTIATKFLHSIGYVSASFSDGSYDGGKDFYFHTEPVKGISIGIQISIEKNWQGKLKKDVEKAKGKYAINAMIFVSSRRIPLDTFEEFSRKILQELGVSVTRYDNQAIATEFIRTNRVIELYTLAGVDASSAHMEPRGVTAKHEAASALVMFGTSAEDLRSEMFQSIIKAQLLKEPVERNLLIDLVLRNHGMSDMQKVVIAKHLTRLQQSKEVQISKEGLVTLSKEEESKYQGVQTLLKIQFEELTKRVEKFLSEKLPKGKPSATKIVVDNLLNLSTELVRRNTPHHKPTKEGEVFLVIRNVLISYTDDEEVVSTLLNELADLVVKSGYAQQVIAAELCTALLSSDSPQLIAALGGQKGLNVYLDTSVAIPLMCGLLFDGVTDRATYSAKLLRDLMSEHQFSGFLPTAYLEEVAAHLIDAGRYYKELVNSGEDLSYSGNAFVSHFARYVQALPDSKVSFQQYVEAFGLKRTSELASVSDAEFWAERDRLVKHLWRLFERYDFRVIDVDSYGSKEVLAAVRVIASQLIEGRPDIVIKHDAQVIDYLESPQVGAGIAKILCTWDILHERYNPAWASYCVLSPVALSDLFAVLKDKNSDRPISQLKDFVRLQTDKSLAATARLWDELIRIEKGGLADAVLLGKAQSFKTEYIATHGSEEFSGKAVASAWKQWLL